MSQEKLAINIEDIIEKMSHMKIRVENYGEVLVDLEQLLSDYSGKLDTTDKNALGYDALLNNVRTKKEEMTGSMKAIYTKLSAQDASNQILATYYATGETYNQSFANFFSNTELQENIQIAVALSLGIEVDLVNQTFDAVEIIDSRYEQTSLLLNAITNQMNHGVKYGSAKGNITFFGSNAFIKENMGGNIRWMTKVNYLNYSLKEGLNSAHKTITLQKGTALSKSLLIGSAALAVYNNYQEHSPAGDMDRIVTDSMVDITGIVAGVYAGKVGGAAVTSVVIMGLTSSGITVPYLLPVIVTIGVGILISVGIVILFDKLKDPAADAWDGLQDSVNNLKNLSVGW